LLLSGLVLLLATIAFGAMQYRSAPQTHTAPSTAGQPPDSTSLTFSAMGDQLAHDSINAAAKTLSSYDYTVFYRVVRPHLSKSDVVFCNPETLAVGPAYGISGYPTFNAPEEFARGLRDEVKGPGCNLINLASNHLNDKGQPALDATVSLWESLQPLAFTGANRSAEEQSQVKFFTKNGVTVAFLAFADYSNNPAVSAFGLNLYHDQSLVDRLVTQARQHADLVLVSMHWGAENHTIENEDQRAAAAKLASLGVDVIIGTGPHVLQKITWLPRPDGQKTLVFYSLGNTLSAQLKIDELTGGIAGFRATKTNSGLTIDQVSFVPTFMSYRWDAAAKATDNLSARTDFQLRPLKAADREITAMFGHPHNADERLRFVRATLGDDTAVQIKE